MLSFWIHDSFGDTIMDTKTDENLQEFSEPLLKKSRKFNIKPTRKDKKNKNANNNNNNDSSSNQKVNPGLRSNASTYSILPISEVTQGALEIWAQLPDEIRQDPSLASFRQEHERIHGKWTNKTSNAINKTREKKTHRREKERQNKRKKNMSIRPPSAFSLSRRFFQLCLCSSRNEVTAMSILITVLKLNCSSINVCW